MRREGSLQIMAQIPSDPPTGSRHGAFVAMTSA